MTSAKINRVDMLWEPRNELLTQIDCIGHFFPEVIFKMGVCG